MPADPPAPAAAAILLASCSIRKSRDQVLILHEIFTPLHCSSSNSRRSPRPSVPSEIRTQAEASTGASSPPGTRQPTRPPSSLFIGPCAATTHLSGVATVPGSSAMADDRQEAGEQRSMLLLAASE
ncbi:hypothetical protein PAHAL_5G507600 [Panicum hallii]|uniref:Uncharacterized protein n=1 Tax=Panicum hallii TaxID=206008 RepID=A0A2T8IP55_9POAL|nr:hypothetical protein PAHAL_5G507600 [Panicum hallii]